MQAEELLGIVAATAGLLIKLPVTWQLFRLFVFSICNYNPRRQLQRFALLKSLDLRYFMIELSGQLIGLVWNRHRLLADVYTHAELYPLSILNSFIIWLVLMLHRRYFLASVWILLGATTYYLLWWMIHAEWISLFTDFLLPWSAISIVLVLFPGVWFAYKRKSARGLSPWMLSTGLILGLIRVYTVSKADINSKIDIGTLPGPLLTLIMLYQWIQYGSEVKKRRRQKLE